MAYNLTGWESMIELGNEKNVPLDTGATPMFPLGSVLFPGAPLALHVFEPRYQRLIADVMTGDRLFGVVLISRGSEVGGGDERLAIGTLATIEGLSQIDAGQFALLARGLHRIRVVRWLEDAPYPRAVTEQIPENRSEVGRGDVKDAFNALRRARALLSELHDTPPLPSDFDPPTGADNDVSETLWSLCSLAPFDAFDRQRLLEAPSVRERLQLLAALCDELADDVTTMLGQGGDR